MWRSLLGRPVPSKDAMETAFQHSLPKSKGNLSIKIQQQNLSANSTALNGGSWQPLRLVHADQQNDDASKEDVNGNCSTDMLDSMVQELVGVNVSEVHIPTSDENGAEVMEAESDHSQKESELEKDTGVSITEVDENDNEVQGPVVEEVAATAAELIETSGETSETIVSSPASEDQPSLSAESESEVSSGSTEAATLVIKVKSSAAQLPSVETAGSQSSLVTENILKVVTNDVNVNEKTLTRLVIHKKATNELLKFLAESTKNLKILDVKGSPDVTNEGIQYLFVGEKMANLNNALSSVSWKVKHAQRWTNSSVCSSLEWLDISYTGANHSSKKLVTMLPGVHWFPRQWFAELGNSTGHYVFLKKDPTLEFKMRDMKEYRIKLSVLLGSRSSSALQKLAVKHSWNSCLASVHVTDKLKKEGQILLTACEDSRRIYGEVLFQGGEVSGLYSIFPMDVNVIMEACPRIQKLSSPLTHACLGNQTQLLSLNSLNTTCDVVTMASLLPHCPRLKSLRWRLSSGLLDDQKFLKMALESKCFARLEELCIIPACKHLNKAGEACLGKSESRCLRKAKSSVGRLHSAGQHTSPNGHHQTPPRRIGTACSESYDKQHGGGTGVVLKPVRKSSVASTTAQGPVDKIEVGLVELNMGDCDGRCLLSMESFNLILKACSKLEKIGNLMFWEGVQEEELDGLRAKNLGIPAVPEVETEEVPKWDFDVSTGWNMG